MTANTPETLTETQKSRLLFHPMAPNNRNHANSPEEQDALQRRRVLYRDEPTQRQPRRSKIRIHMPFNTWSLERIRKGTKRATTRTKRYGSPGDTFHRPWENIHHPSHHQDETRRSRSISLQRRKHSHKRRIIEVWKSLHPHKRYDPEQLVH
jgi:hypothetical protein